MILSRKDPGDPGLGTDFGLFGGAGSGNPPSIYGEEPRQPVKKKKFTVADARKALVDYLGEDRVEGDKNDFSIKMNEEDEYLSVDVDEDGGVIDITYEYPKMSFSKNPKSRPKMSSVHWERKTIDGMMSIIRSYARNPQKEENCDIRE